MGAKELSHGNMDPNPEKTEGFVVTEFDLDKLKVNRLGYVPKCNLLVCPFVAEHL